MQFETKHAAPNAPSRSRRTVAVGETVEFSAASGVTWRASAAFSEAKEDDGATSRYTWRAPARPGPQAVFYAEGGVERQIAMMVIAPSTIRHDKAEEARPSPAGASMKATITLGPDTVSWAETSLEEIGGSHASPQNVIGYFEHYRALGGDLTHRPEPRHAYGNGMWDDVSIEGLPRLDGAYTDGHYQWDIPQKWSVDGQGGGEIATVTQDVRIDAAGTVVITKGNARVERALDDATVADTRKLHGALVGERLDLLVQRFLDAPDDATRREIHAIIRGKRTTVELAFRADDSTAGYWETSVSNIALNMHPVAVRSFELGKGALGTTTILFADAFPIDELRSRERAKVQFLVDGRSHEVSFDPLRDTEFVPTPTPACSLRYRIIDR